MKLWSICIGILCCFLTVKDSQASSRYDTMGEQVLEEINLARAEPQLYAEYIREWRKHFKGKFYRLPDMKARRQTREGVAALDEAIQFLNGQEPLPPLKWSSKLTAAAVDLSREQARIGATGHQTVNTGGMRPRRHGVQGSRIGEDIDYLPNEPRLLVMQLIVDDGVPGRGHRKNLFNPHFKKAGVACGPHRLFGTMCVADFSSK